MILLIESGSSKADWCLLDGKNVIQKIQTIGLNPYFVDAERISDTIANEILPVLNASSSVEDIYFYGAGCSNEKMCGIVEAGLRNQFSTARIYVLSDMLAAARSLCGDGPGFVAILGTGSNSCAYKDGLIIEQVPSLGFILGDEGSGSDLGKRLLQAYCYNEMKPELLIAFEKKFKVNREFIIESVYKKPLPNRFVASFVPFLLENPDENFTSMIAESFDSFLTRHIRKYKLLPIQTPLYVTGSVAWVFKEILTEEIKKHGFVLGEISQSPLDGLVKYHTMKYRAK
ncbi:MAG: hypothetical protein EYC69_03490 [Bacteroidetes bacterium]|nr:MAG: hypothetical protein EYC69_03490 [Bacteroidota bacterium]